MTTATTKPRPIVFTGDEVREYLVMGKVTLWREIRPQPKILHAEVSGLPPDVTTSFAAWDHVIGPKRYLACPLGKVGDEFWGREDYWVDRREPGVVIYDATPEWGKYLGQEDPIRSTFPDETFPTREESRAAMLPKFWSKRDAIVMPNWASRISGVIASVAVERRGDVWGWLVGCERGGRG